MLPLLAKWQRPSSPKYFVPVPVVQNSATISLAAAGAILLAVVNLEMFPATGEPEAVTEPAPGAIQLLTPAVVEESK